MSAEQERGGQVTQLRWGSATDVGRVRSNNQDSSLVALPLFAVADGMGGHAAGEVASRLALDTLRNSITDQSLESLVAGVKLANTRVFEMSHTDPSMRGMGTTLCAVALVTIDGHERLAVVNVGDSRVYVLQDGALIQVSEDHSLVESMVRQGTITPEQAKVHPQRNILTRALGIDGEVGVDSWEVAPFSGDRYLLCSDGLFNEVTDDRIAEVLTDNEDPQEAAEILVQMANEGGGRDNITVVIVDVVEGLDPAEAEAPEEAVVGLEGFDPDKTAAITPIGDWVEDTLPPEPSEHDLRPRCLRRSTPTPSSTTTMTPTVSSRSAVRGRAASSLGARALSRRHCSPWSASPRWRSSGTPGAPTTWASTHGIASPSSRASPEACSGSSPRW